MIKKQICFIITKSNFGGAQKYVYELATSLDKEIFKVTVALGGDGILKQKLLDSNIEVITIPNLERDISISKEFSTFMFLYNLFKERHFDVVHLNSSKIGGIGSLTARINGIPKVIFTAHGWAFNENRHFVSKLLIKIAYWFTIIFCDKTIAVSRNIKEQVFHWPFISNKIKVIHNGIKPINFYEKADSRQKLFEKNPKIDTNKFLIGTIAELHPIKGLDILIESAKQVTKNRDVQFVIIGEGNLKVELENLIKTNNLENNVVLMGFLDNASEYLKGFDLVILPSRSEALALVVLETGLANVPIIASRVGGIPEIISESKFGELFEKENYIELAQKINHTIENYEDSKQNAENLKQRILQDFTHQKMLEETISLY